MWTNNEKRFPFCKGGVFERGNPLVFVHRLFVFHYLDFLPFYSIAERFAGIPAAICFVLLVSTLLITFDAFPRLAAR